MKRYVVLLLISSSLQASLFVTSEPMIAEQFQAYEQMCTLVADDREQEVVVNSQLCTETRLKDCSLREQLLEEIRKATPTIRQVEKLQVPLYICRSSLYYSIKKFPSLFERVTPLYREINSLANKIKMAVRPGSCLSESLEAHISKMTKLIEQFYFLIEENCQSGSMPDEALESTGVKELFDEIKKEDPSLEVVQKCRSTTDQLPCEFNGWLPLHYAVKKDKPVLCKLFLQQGDDVNATILGEQFTPLFIAASQGNEKVCHLLLEQDDIDVDVATREGKTPLHALAQRGSIDLVRRLIKKGASVAKQTDKGCTALHFAIAANSVPLIRLLLENGVPIDSQTKKGRTALYHAVHEGNVDLVVELLQHKPRLDLADDNGETAFDKAFSHSNESLSLAFFNAEVSLPFPVEDDLKMSVYHKVFSSSGNLYQAFLARLTDVDPKDADGNTPLCNAIQQGNEQAITLLLNAKASVLSSNNRGETPLHLAAQFNAELCELLLQSGAQLDAQNKYGETPLLCAIKNKKATSAQLLIDWGADVALADNKKRTPLHEAVFNNMILVVEPLLYHGANYASLDSEGNTPLAIAKVVQAEAIRYLLEEEEASCADTPVLRGKSRSAHSEKQHTIVESRPCKQLYFAISRNASVEQCKVLIASGARLDTQGLQGKTALHLAAEKGMTAVCIALLEAGASPLIRDAKGRSPLELAADQEEGDTLLVMTSYLLERIQEVMGSTEVKHKKNVSVKNGEVVSVQAEFEEELEHHTTELHSTSTIDTVTKVLVCGVASLFLYKWVTQETK